MVASGAGASAAASSLAGSSAAAGAAYASHDNELLMGTINIPRLPLSFSLSWDS